MPPSRQRRYGPHRDRIGHRVRLRFAARFAMAAATLGASVAGAAETPASAKSLSLLIPPVLLDHPYLAHEYPHRSAGVGTCLRASPGAYVGTVDERSDLVVGFVGGGRRGSVFLLAQGHELARIREETTLWQAGAATRFGEWALGAALRGATGSSERDDIDVFREGERRGSSDSYRADRREAAAGIGFARGRFALDLAGEMLRESYEIRVFSISRDDSSDYHLEDEPLWLASGSIRVAIPLSKRLLLVGAGAYREHTSREVRRMTIASGETIEARRRQYAHRWHVGLAVELERPEGRRVRAFARYRDDRSPDGFRTFGTGQVEEWRSREHFEELLFGGGFERPLPADFGMSIGFRGAFRIRTLEERILRPDRDPQTRLNRTVSETMERWFAWGLDRRWRDWTFASVVRANLPASDLLVRVDAALHF